MRRRWLVSHLHHPPPPFLIHTLSSSLLIVQQAILLRLVSMSNQKHTYPLHTRAPALPPRPPSPASSLCSTVKTIGCCLVYCSMKWGCVEEGGLGEFWPCFTFMSKVMLKEIKGSHDERNTSIEPVFCKRQPGGNKCGACVLVFAQQNIGNRSVFNMHDWLIKWKGALA